MGNCHNTYVPCVEVLLLYLNCYFKMVAATVAETAFQDRQDTATSPLAPLGDDDFDDEDGIQGRFARLLS